MVKFPKKLPLEQRTNKQTNKVMLIKALNNAGVGFPMSALLNVVFTLPISSWWLAIHGSVALYPLVLGAPFVVVSVFRQYLIDYFMAVYNVNCDPSYLIRIGFKKLLNKIKRKSN